MKKSQGGVIMRSKGFTLIELAIVLVIIGIILGAVLKGQELINSAKEKNFIQKLKQLAAAQYTYYDKYGHFAGDTDNDGLIDDDDSAWGNLTATGLLSESDRYHPFNGNFSFHSDSYNYIEATNVPKWVAQYVDTKLDDGQGNSGLIKWGDSTTGRDYSNYNDNDKSNLYWWFDK